MADRKATNKWIPPDFDPQKHGSINTYHGSHPLRERARKQHLGILIIRFEMVCCIYRGLFYKEQKSKPFNVWCEHCKAHIGMGVRYNAEKKRVGSYYTTPIYEFRMKCHLCSGWMTIRTDPQNTTYQCISGVRKKVEEYEAAPETTGQIRLDGDEIIERLAQDPFYKLEHGKRDQQKLAAAKPVVDSLLAINQRQWSDPYQRSRDLRKRFRDEKEAGQKRLVESRQLANKFGIGISGVLRIAEETKEDRLASMRTEFNLLNDEAVRRQQQAEIGGIFDSPQMPLKSTTQLLGAELKRRKLQQELSNSSNISLDDVILRPRSK